MSFFEKVMNSLSAKCGNCIHCKVDEKGIDYCEEYDRNVDFINIFCKGFDYEPLEEEDE